MSSPPYMKLYVGDYFGDTHHLGVCEHGAYLLLLMAMWRAGGSLPAKDANLAKLARCTVAEWAIVKPAVMPFFKVMRGQLTHKRVAQEIAKYESTSEKRSAAAKSGSRKKALQINADTSAIADEKIGKEPHNQNQNQNQNQNGIDEPPSESPSSSADADNGAANDAVLFALFGDPGPEAAVPDPAREAFDAYNVLAADLGLPIANALTDERRRKLNQRMKGSPGRWFRALEVLRFCRWCHGYNERRFRADFDFLLQAKSFESLLDGRYNHLATTETRDGKAQRSKLDDRHDNMRRAVTAPSLTAGREPA